MRRYFEIAIDTLREARWLTSERMRLCGSALAFVTIGILAMNIAARHNLPELTDAAGDRFGKDFIQFWSSARLAAAGNPAAAYVLGAPDHIAEQAISYPPVLMLLCWPLAGLSYVQAMLLWGSLGLALFTCLLSRLVGWEMAVFAAIATPAALFNIFLQQNGYFTAALLAGGLLFVESRPALAGVMLGMLCYKPQFGVLLLPALVAGGYWRVLAVAAVTALLLAAASAILFGLDTWTSFFGRMFVQREFMETRAIAWPWMPTVFVMMRLFGAGPPAAYAIQGVSAVCAAVAVAALWRERCPLAVKSAGLLIAGFLATPYAWDYDAVVLTFAAAWLATEGVRTGFQSWEKITVLVLLIFPAVSLIPAVLVRFQIGPVLLWAALAIVLRRGLSLRPQQPAPLRPIQRRGLYRNNNNNNK